ncbi:MAG: cytochrome ubiquinol oxidase subunit I [Armatimonadetes bacterium]|nr:cytochrome ubiquinol oxidase subunit I [Armatimonadota bacterium]
MHYPWWYVPALTAPMLIALVAVLHIYVAMYAVGGGILLAAETARAHRDDDQETLGYLKRHAWFFILVTVVYGAMTGVGIWWTIGLASPLATEALIHIFVFGWAIEWCAFIIEVVAAFLFYYFWGRVTPQLHTQLGWIYAASAWISLVLITGITAFQLNPGAWPETGGFWTAFFNPQFVPQTLARTGGALLLALLYFYLHGSFALEGQETLRRAVFARLSRWTVPAGAMIILGGLGWALFLPPSGKAIVEGTGAMNVFAGVVVAVTTIVLGLSYYGPMRRPQDVSRTLAIALFCLGLIAIGASEFLREATRKPFVVFDLVYGHGLYKDEVPAAQAGGLLREGTWTRAYAKRYPGLLAADGEVNPWRLAELPAEARRDLGRTLFMYHCNDCHAERGYSGVHGLIRGWQRSDITRVVNHPDRIHYFMPPWSGHEAETQALIEYLESITPPHPLEDRPTRQGGARTQPSRSEG